jgi:queuine tRNA-ribosyltransferase/7-cyano-7-deazaguanine tRNA-ribosyltransferase
MFDFKILKKSKKSRARLGILKTPHGEIQTPTLVAVGTQAGVKTLDSADVVKTKTQIIISNTFHLHLKPGEKVVKSHGGLHKFANLNLPIMTDSGGYQVFSLGFGRDLQIGKVIPQLHSGTNYSLSLSKGYLKTITSKDRPKLLKIKENGVLFRSPIDGREVFIGPKESIKIQEALGADIIFAFDECPPPNADYEYMKKSLETTHAWARECLKYKKSKQALYGIVQGGRFRDLREQSAKTVAAMPFDGFGIGGEFGADKIEMKHMLGWVTDNLPEEKPRHLLGIGAPEDLKSIIQAGVDTFDCTIPTHFARHGVAFTSGGKLDLKKSIYLKDKKPLDPQCVCEVCASYSRGYISHLLRAREVTPLRLLTLHNLFYFNTLVENLRAAIKAGKL